MKFINKEQINLFIELYQSSLTNDFKSLILAEKEVDPEKFINPQLDILYKENSIEKFVFFILAVNQNIKLLKWQFKTGYFDKNTVFKVYDYIFPLKDFYKEDGYLFYKFNKSRNNGTICTRVNFFHPEILEIMKENQIEIDYSLFYEFDSFKRDNNVPLGPLRKFIMYYSSQKGLNEILENLNRNQKRKFFLRLLREPFAFPELDQEIIYSYVLKTSGLNLQKDFPYNKKTPIFEYLQNKNFKIEVLKYLVIKHNLLSGLDKKEKKQLNYYLKYGFDSLRKNSMNYPSYSNFKEDEVKELLEKEMRKHSFLDECLD